MKQHQFVCNRLTNHNKSLWQVFVIVGGIKFFERVVNDCPFSQVEDRYPQIRLLGEYSVIRENYNKLALKARDINYKKK